MLMQPTKTSGGNLLKGSNNLVNSQSVSTTLLSDAWIFFKHKFPKSISYLFSAAQIVYKNRLEQGFTVIRHFLCISYQGSPYILVGKPYSPR
jgi:hypothetical protein